MQTKDLLVKLLSQAGAALNDVSTQSHRPKLLLKVAPDLTASELTDIAAAVRTGGVDGVIVSNTTIARPSSLSHRKFSRPFCIYNCSFDEIANKTEIGGLSGPPLKPLSLAALRTLRAHLPPSIALIGSGGISTGADALEFARAGASFVQIYTAFGYDGPGTARRIKDEIAAQLRKEGTTWEKVVAKGVKEFAGTAIIGEGEKKEGESGVKQLIEEAEHLKGLLDKLAGSFSS